MIQHTKYYNLNLSVFAVMEDYIVDRDNTEWKKSSHLYGWSSSEMTRIDRNLNFIYKYLVVKCQPCLSCQCFRVTIVSNAGLCAKSGRLCWMQFLEFTDFFSILVGSQ